MRYRALDTNLLVMLDILLDTLSLTRTAEMLGLTQPAVSAALARLRDHFGDELLVQVGRTNIATPLAERLRAPLTDLLARTDALIAQRPGFDPARDDRRFSFIGSDYVATTFGGEILRDIASAGPHLSARLETLDRQTIDDFDRGKIDVVIAPRQITQGDHPTQGLFEERFVCAVWAEHPTIGDAITPEQYRAARHVVHHSRHAGPRFQILDQWFLKQSAVARRVAVQVPSFAHILPVLPGTPYVATVQHRLAVKMARQLPIRILPAPFDFPLMTIVMQWHRHLDDDAGLGWFRTRVEDTIRRLGF